MRTIFIGSRGSQLALAQARLVLSALEAAVPGFAFSLKIIRTQGDEKQNLGLGEFGSTGVFTKELENALLAGKIDLAVHSMKDLPTSGSDGLSIAAMLEREDPRDVFVSSGAEELKSLPKGARLGTGSLRRIAQLRHLRPDLVFDPVRGNLNTRLRKLSENNLAGIILAMAGIRRLGWEDEVTQVLSSDMCLPAAGQGALGVQVRSDDKEMAELAKVLDHFPTHTAVLAERAFLSRVEGGCHVPVGTLAEVQGTAIILKGVIASLDGSRLLRGEERGFPHSGSEVGLKLGEKLLAQGGGAILEQARCEADG